ncbi:glycosyltransferase [Flavobacteriaceae bacterium R38]|nr:glycosyltransferase [Flavobacteriaceae bacterium R38]
MEKKKLLFIMQLPPPVHGASMMNRYIKESVNINNAFSTDYLPLSFADKIEDIGKLSLKKILRMVAFIFKLITKLIKTKPNLIYYTISPFGGAFYRDAIFVFIIKLFRIKIVFHLHGKGIIDQCRKKIKKKIYSYTFKNTSVITLSEMLDYDIKDIHKGNIYNLPNGIEINELEINDKSKASIKVLYLSNLVKAKGILDLIQALQIMPKISTEYSVDIIGDSADVSVEGLRSIVKRSKLDTLVNVLGPKYGKEKWEAFKNSDIFVFPSHNECFPLVLLEAMQFKNAIISTDNGAIKEIIQNCGIIVPQKSPKDLTITLKDLILDKQKIQLLKEKSQKEFREKYTLEIFENNLIKILNCILNEN